MAWFGLKKSAEDINTGFKKKELNLKENVMNKVAGLDKISRKTHHKTFTEHFNSFFKAKESFDIMIADAEMLISKKQNAKALFLLSEAKNIALGRMISTLQRIYKNASEEGFDKVASRTGQLAAHINDIKENCDSRIHGVRIALIDDVRFFKSKSHEAVNRMFELLPTFA